MMFPTFFYYCIPPQLGEDTVAQRINGTPTEIFLGYANTTPAPPHTLILLALTAELVSVEFQLL